MRADTSEQDWRFSDVDLPDEPRSEPRVRPPRQPSNVAAYEAGGFRRPLVTVVGKGAEQKPGGAGRNAGLAAMLQHELDFERAVTGCRQIAAFRRNAATWELLLLLALNHGQAGMGIHETIDQIQCGALGQSALLKFIQQQRAAGTIVVSPSADKRSKAALSLSAPLMQELETFIARRNRLLLAGAAAA